MDREDIEEKRWQIAGGAALVATLIAWAVVYRPAASALDRWEHRQREVTAEIEAVNESIDGRGGTPGDHASPPKRFVILQEPGASAGSRLEQLLAAISRSADAHGVRYSELTPKAARRHPRFEEAPFSLSASGPYGSIVSFLYGLEVENGFVVRSPVIQRDRAAEQVEFRGEVAAIVIQGSAPEEPATPRGGAPTPLELARNPFAKPDARLATNEKGRQYFLNVLPGHSLGGTMETKRGPVAIIDGNPYRVGDRLEDKTITAIEKNRVQLRDAIRSYVLESVHPAIGDLDQRIEKEPPRR